MFRANDDEVISGVASKTSKIVMDSSRNLTYVLNIRATKESNFLTSNAKKVFNYLQLVFIKVLILYYFNLESYI